MDQLKFTLRSNGKGLLFHKPTINLQTTQQQIKSLPNFKSKLLAYYKRFYKLRNFECSPSLFKVDNSPYHTPTITSDEYVTLLKRQFQRGDFNLKRKKFLGLPPITEDELINERLLNTLCFIFNHTTAAPNPKLDKLIVTEQDEIESSVDTLESKVVSTILRMDYDCPNFIKYDFKFDWVKQIDAWLDNNRNEEKEPLADMEKENQKSKKGKKSGKQGPIGLDYLKYKQYYTTLMRMNESLKTCF
ncbi:uncharacterized protein KGF55_002916 [Candida pseudojiufengensis]|uniref:uncharacterized protein n=1 Tax=Candida pseudojiufengensis TaxID=497109 RepID=UPI0022251A10|nr:uncharacterized protein KGF55_002916 [Candida pseudojiufengensis]KAI5963124.1 hypothetical protein KGF55_002916 [Candida pseudojiufengensis]